MLVWNLDKTLCHYWWCIKDCIKKGHGRGFHVGYLSKLMCSKHLCSYHILKGVGVSLGDLRPYLFISHPFSLSVFPMKMRMPLRLSNNVVISFQIFRWPCGNSRHLWPGSIWPSRFIRLDPASAVFAHRKFIPKLETKKDVTAHSDVNEKYWDLRQGILSLELLWEIKQVWMARNSSSKHRTLEISEFISYQVH